jgi:hypothetical protein
MVTNVISAIFIIQRHKRQKWPSFINKSVFQSVAHSVKSNLFFFSWKNYEWKANSQNFLLNHQLITAESEIADSKALIIDLEIVSS